MDNNVIVEVKNSKSKKKTKEQEEDKGEENRKTCIRENERNIIYSK